MKGKRLWPTVLGLALMMSVVTACSAPVTGLSEDDETAIYTGVAKDLYQSTGPANFPVTYLVVNTDDSVGIPSTPKSNSRALGRKTRREIPLRLNQLPTELFWIEKKDAAPLESNGKVGNGGAIITFSNSHLQDDGSVLVSASLYSSPDVATAKTYIFEKISGAWKIVETRSNTKSS